MLAIIHRLKNVISQSASCCALAGVMLAGGEVLAGELSSIRLKFEYVNDYAAGYDASNHTYRTAYINKVILKPSTRPVRASICKSLPTVKVRMTSVKDGGRCQPRTDRVAPGVAALVWTLNGRHPILNKTVVLQTIRKELKPADRRPDGKGCLPLKASRDPVVPDSACFVDFDVPLAGGAAASAGLPFSIHVEAVNAKGKVIESRTKSFEVPRKVPLIVSVGESLASGEGNPDVRGKSKDNNYDPLGRRDCEDDTVFMYARDSLPDMLKKPVWLERDDHRSLKSGPALAVQELLQNWPYVNFMTFAKSGASIISAERKHDIVDQLGRASDQLGDYRVDVLLVSAGGNDVGFSDSLKTLVKDFKSNKIRDVRKKFDGRIKRLTEAGYPELARRISKLNVGTVIINEYPNALFNNASGVPSEGCGIFDNTRVAKISKDDAEAINKMGKVLNDEVKAAARKFNWRFVGSITEKFARHGYCTGKQSYFRSATDSCDMQGDFRGTMHPNERGTAIYASALAAELKRALPRPEVSLAKQ